MYCDSYCQHPTCWNNIQNQLKNKIVKQTDLDAFEQRYNENRRLYRLYEQSDVKPLNVKNVLDDLEEILPYERPRFRSPVIERIEKINNKKQNESNNQSRIDNSNQMFCSSVSTFQFISQPIGDKSNKITIKNDPYHLQKCMMWIPKEKQKNDKLEAKHKNKVAEVDISNREVLEAIETQTNNSKTRKLSTQPPTGGQPYRNNNLLQRIESRQITDETMAAILGIPVDSVKYMMLIDNEYEKKTLVRTNDFEDVIKTFEKLNMNNTQIIILHNNSNETKILKDIQEVNRNDPYKSLHANSFVQSELNSASHYGLNRRPHPSMRSVYDTTDKLSEIATEKSNEKPKDSKKETTQSIKSKGISAPKTTPITQISLDLPELPNYGVKVTKPFTYTKNNFMNLALEPIVLTSTPNNYQRLTSSVRSKKATVSSNSGPPLSSTSTTPYNLDYDFYVNQNMKNNDNKLLNHQQEIDNSNKVVIQMNLNSNSFEDITKIGITDSNTNLNIPPNPTPEPTIKPQTNENITNNKKFEGLTVEVLKEIGEYDSEDEREEEHDEKNKSDTAKSVVTDKENEQITNTRVDLLSPIMENNTFE